MQWCLLVWTFLDITDINPDSKVHGANMGPTWDLSAPDGPHVGPMNLAIREEIILAIFHKEIWKHWIKHHLNGLVQERHNPHELGWSYLYLSCTISEIRWFNVILNHNLFVIFGTKSCNNFIVALHIITIWDPFSISELEEHFMGCLLSTRYVDGTPTSEVTLVTIRYIRPPHPGHTSQYHGHAWMTHILFIPSQSAIPFLRWWEMAAHPVHAELL